MIVAHAFLCDIEEWIAQGWFVGRIDNLTAVQRAYGSCYVWRWV